MDKPSRAHPSVNLVSSAFKIHPACDDCSKPQPVLGHQPLSPRLGRWLPNWSPCFCFCPTWPLFHTAAKVILLEVKCGHYTPNPLVVSISLGSECQVLNVPFKALHFIVCPQPCPTITSLNLPLSPTSFSVLFQLLWLSVILLTMPGSLLPQGLSISCSLCLNHSLPRYLWGSLPHPF